MMENDGANQHMALVAHVPTPGLQNLTGEYNCFLNVIVQCLWHCMAFRSGMLHRLYPEQLEVLPLPPVKSPVLTRTEALFACMNPCGWCAVPILYPPMIFSDQTHFLHPANITSARHTKLLHPYPPLKSQNTGLEGICC